MKTLLLIVMSFLVISCSSQPTHTAKTAKEYRQGMENGGLAATVLVSDHLCKTLSASSKQCTELRGLMVINVTGSVKKVPESQVVALLKEDNNYRTAMKQGSKVFSQEVGNMLCRALNVSYERCGAFQEEIIDKSNTFIDSMDDKAIENIRRESDEEDLVA